MLTFEQTRGTKTYYLPLDRSTGISPEVTLMVRREPGDIYVAGFAVRSLEEPFVKREGRLRAYKRLQHAPYGQGNVRALGTGELIEQLCPNFEAINERHPGTVSSQTYLDLEILAELLEAAFNRLEKNQLLAKAAGS